MEGHYLESQTQICPLKVVLGQCIVAEIQIEAQWASNGIQNMEHLFTNIYFQCKYMCS